MKKLLCLLLTLLCCAALAAPVSADLILPPDSTLEAGSIEFTAPLDIVSPNESTAEQKEAAPPAATKAVAPSPGQTEAETVPTTLYLAVGVLVLMVGFLLSRLLRKRDK
ncbi:MAG: hypothetical protein IKO68_05155 [Oscillospiraceae bacterium]|nr:hypothetical protein [Oscillospiraceae bacterium]MBR4655948.1 hypothetical protein [Oscillospiraceae bacterium]